MALLLIRHGQSTANVGGRLVSRTDAPLSDLGTRQATALAGRLAAGPTMTVARVVGSPALRARQTAGLIGEAVGCEVGVDDDWREMDFGEWEGQALTKLRPHPGEGFFDRLDFRPPGGESMEELAQRVSHAWRRSSGIDDVTCVVTHMGPIKWALTDVVGCGVAGFRRLRVDEASISEISWRSGTWLVERVNDRAHLESF